MTELEEEEKDIIFVVVAELKNVASTVERGAISKEIRLIGRALRTMMLLRKRLNYSIVSAFLKHYLPSSSDLLPRLLFCVSNKVRSCSVVSFFLYVSKIACQIR